MDFKETKYEDIPRTTMDNVLVLPHVEEATTDGGIHRPDGSRKQLCSGTIVAVGPDLEKLDYADRPRPDDLVVWPDYVSGEVEFNGQTYVSLCWRDVRIWHRRTAI